MANNETVSPIRGLNTAQTDSENTRFGRGGKELDEMGRKNALMLGVGGPVWYNLKAAGVCSTEDSLQCCSSGHGQASGWRRLDTLCPTGETGGRHRWVR